MTNFKIGGVPEHFNLPWHLAIENGFFEKENISVSWTDFHGGTGQMTKALRDGEVDVCILLTEGIISDIINGNPSRIIQKYINTPLIWGVHTGANNPLEYYGQIYDQKYAISRFGSGSHLMAIVDANQKNLKLKKEQFHIIKNLDGALDSLQKNETDVFFWEKYTTKPYVIDGKLKRLGEYVTPWPCFVVVARNEVIEKHPEKLKDLLKVINFTSKQFMTTLNAVEIISKRYHLDFEDAKSWFYSTEWATNNHIQKKTIDNVLHHLHAANIINKDISSEELCWEMEID